MNSAEFIDNLIAFVTNTLKDKEATEAQLDAATSIATTLLRTDYI